MARARTAGKLSSPWEDELRSHGIGPTGVFRGYKIVRQSDGEIAIMHGTSWIGNAKSIAKAIGIIDSLTTRENPRKNVERVYAAWQRGVKLNHGRGASVSTNGETIWSYQTWLVYRDYRGEVMFNTTHYSQTTTTQQNGLRQMLDEDGVKYKKAQNVPRGSHSPATSLGASLKNPRKRTRNNPSLVVFGNPSRVLSRNVVEIRYQHEEDGQFYRHKFARNQVQLRGDAEGKTAVLKRVDGKSLLKEY